MTAQELDELDIADADEWRRLASTGDYARAWVVSDRIRQRRRVDQAPTIPRHLQRVWDGTSLVDRRVLIRCYHGLGDTIQFIRYAPLVRTIAREVIVWCQPALIPLLSPLRGIDRMLPLHDGTPDTEFDVDIEVMELPYAFRTTLATIPGRVPYLDASRLPLPTSRPRVGIVWRGGDWNEERSLPFNCLGSLLDGPAVSWCGLQLDPSDSERHANLMPIDTRGIVRTARVMQAMDLVISIDSMSAHLAGALGRPVWTLLSHDADWRWMRNRSDSPWYPTMRLFRQPEPGDWPSVVDAVHEAMRQGVWRMQAT